MPRCDCGTKGVPVVLDGEEGRAGDHGSIKCMASPELMGHLKGCSVCVCVCVTGTAGLSAPQESENAPLSKTVSQELLWVSEQLSELNGGTFPVDTMNSLNVYLLC